MIYWPTSKRTNQSIMVSFVIIHAKQINPLGRPGSLRLKWMGNGWTDAAEEEEGHHHRCRPRLLVGQPATLDQMIRLIMSKGGNSGHLDAAAGLLTLPRLDPLREQQLIYKFLPVIAARSDSECECCCWRSIPPSRSIHSSWRRPTDPTTNSRHSHLPPWIYGWKKKEQETTPRMRIFLAWSLNNRDSIFEKKKEKFLSLFPGKQS